VQGTPSITNNNNLLVVHKEIDKHTPLFLDECTFTAAILCTCLLVCAWLFLILDIRLSRYTLYLTFFITAAIMLIRGFLYGFKTCVAGFLFTIAFTLLCIGAEALVPDVSYDGMAYHQVSIIALMSGWNPVYETQVVDWWNRTFPEKAYLGDLVANAGIWTDHYPNGSWVLGAAVSSAFDSLNASKWTQPFFGGLSALVFYRSIRDLKLPAIFAASAAAIAALSPVVLAQLRTNYVDGLVGSALLIQVGASISWYLNRTWTSLAMVMFGCLIAVNLKFTGAIYSFVILFIMISMALARARLGRAEILTLFAGVALTISVSTTTYVRNALTYGHPFYPLNQIDVMVGQAPARFLEQNRWTKFVRATFLLPRGDFVHQHIMHYYAVVNRPDIRASGFGSLFGYSLALCGLLAPLLIWSVVRQWHGADSRLVCLAGVSGAILLSVIINPEFWFARYVPQLWFIPILAAIAFVIVGLKRVGVILLGSALLGAALGFVFWVQQAINSAYPNPYRLLASEDLDKVVLVRGINDDRGVFTFAYEVERLGKQLAFTDHPESCKREVRIGIVGVCL
jgi:hypothetical protein